MKLSSRSTNRQLLARPHGSDSEGFFFSRCCGRHIQEGSGTILCCRPHIRMAAVTNGRLLFNEIPTGYPEPGRTTIYDTSEKIDPKNVPLNGGSLVKVLVLSSDPYLRGRMRDSNIPSYSEAFHLGQPLNNFGVGVVLRSEDPGFKPGDHVYGILPFVQYSIHARGARLLVLKNEVNLPWTTYVGVCGMPGQTAYCAWKELAQAKKGEVAFVTAGAGPVGATVIQLAKADGLKVIASAGSEEKVTFLRSIGADVAFNYKTENTLEILQREGPINVFWDNVGGSTFEAAIEAAARGARFLICGSISDYNGETPYHVKNLMLIVGKELKVSGFLVFTLLPKYEKQFYAEFPKRVASGEIKYLEDVTRGLENAGQSLLDVQKGNNKGKSVILVAEE